jgi:hypothetical protein
MRRQITTRLGSAALLLRHGFLNQTADASKLVNTSFVEYANAALGEYTVRP